jgi:hypothetical protein
LTQLVPGIGQSVLSQQVPGVHWLPLAAAQQRSEGLALHCWRVGEQVSVTQVPLLTSQIVFAP